MHSMVIELLPPHNRHRLVIAPSHAQRRNVFDGEKRSAIVKIANVNVPKIKPNCTTDVKLPRAVGARLNVATRSFITAFPANQSEVQQNCDIIIIGSIILCFFNFIFWGEKVF